MSNDPYAGKTLLCVGGPLDGEYRTVLHGTVMMVAPSQTVVGRAPISDRSPCATVPDFIQYTRREVFLGAGQVAAIWVLKDLSDEEGLRRLESHLAGHKA